VVAAVVLGLLVVALFAPTLAFGLPQPTVVVYRFYNQGSGAHFYTASVEERDYVIATWPDLFTYEGPAFYLYDDMIDGTSVAPASIYLGPSAPVYRFFNVRNGSHFYTISAEEADLVRAKYPDVFRYDGIAFNAYLTAAEYTPLAPVYRFYNKLNGSHFYTISEEERLLVLQYFSDTYEYEGIAFYAMSLTMSD
jgi:hypothetical protein